MSELSWGVGALPQSPEAVKAGFSWAEGMDFLSLSSELLTLVSLAWAVDELYIYIYNIKEIEYNYEIKPFLFYFIKLLK